MAIEDDKKRKEKGVGYFYNPKLLKGTKILDCIPQKGKCPIGKNHDCSIDCYFQENWYVPGYQSNIPSKELAKGKIVRFNSGNDSNVQKELVLKIAKRFDDFFFNTSIPELGFPGPVVFTCNSEKTNERAVIVKAPLNLMFVRFRTNTWNLDLAESVITAYEKQKIPIVLTFMRYKNEERIPLQSRDNYEKKKNVTNPYFMLKRDVRQVIIDCFKEKYSNVHQCGTYESSYCKDCNNCENFYYETLKKIKKLTEN
jgi:hypothetical protein